MEQGQIASFRLTPKDILSIRKISICLMLLFTSMVCQPSRAPLPATIVLTLKTRTNRNRFYTCVMSFGRRGYTTVGASRSRHVPNCVREMDVSPISRGYRTTRAISKSLRVPVHGCQAICVSFVLPTSTLICDGLFFVSVMITTFGSVLIE